MKNLLLICLFSIPILAFAQDELEDGGTWITSGISSGYIKTIKALNVFNGVLIRDSVDCVKLIEESKNFKVKIKNKDLPRSMSQLLKLDDKYHYFLKFHEIKDGIIDLERMRLIKIK